VTVGSDVILRETETAITLGPLGDSPDPVLLRPITTADEPFLRHLYASTRARELAAMPWSDDERRAFCDFQFDCQDRSYRQQFPDARFDIVERAGRAVGRLLVCFGPTACELLDIAIVPESRGAGLGTGLLRWLQGEAAASGLPIVLMVEPGNPSEGLYQRLGFRVRTAGELHREMVWAAEAAGPAALDRFLEVALADGDLRARLAEADDDETLAAAAVGEGLARGLIFTGDDVAGALRDKRRAWIERNVS
jgi:ribosomal protein S18 acetylase RimI-like enzyme